MGPLTTQIDGAQASGTISGEWDDLRRAHARAVSGLVVRLLLRSALGLNPGEVVLNLLALRLVAPAEQGRHQGGGWNRRRHPSVPSLDRDVGATGQHVVQMAGSLMADRVDNLGSQVVIGARKLFCQNLSLIHISEPTRLGMISYAVF